jgi:hypothetical protein
LFFMESNMNQGQQQKMLEYGEIPKKGGAQTVGADTATSPLPNGPQRITGTCLPHNLIPGLMAKVKPSK